MNSASDFGDIDVTGHRKARKDQDCTRDSDAFKGRFELTAHDARGILFGPLAV